MYKKISVIGLGYIGLPTAAVFANHGIKVTGVDVNDSVVSTINKGLIHITEPGLEIEVKKAVKSKNLIAKKAPEKSDAFIIAVPTPFKKTKSEIKEADLSYIKEAIKSISPFLQKNNLVILESTSPVGTTSKILKWIRELRPELSLPLEDGSQSESDINIAYCPERVMPGAVISELINNDRVIGGISKECALNAIKLYKTFVSGECIPTNHKTAEMSKLTENACRDVQIAFANELSIICDQQNINVWDLISLANRHPRINILQPGPGVGGHCIAVDPWFIIGNNKENAEIMLQARRTNEKKKKWVIDKAIDIINKENKDNINVCCFGLTYKPDIDDLRESPALEITELLANITNANIFAVEPNIPLTKKFNGNFSLISYEKACKIADISILLVDHSYFINSKIKPESEHIIDTKGIWK